jgi:ferredoxin
MERNHLNILLSWVVLKVFNMDTIRIYIINPVGEKFTIDADCNSENSIMDVVKEAGFDIGNCGGMALCASCHCIVESEHNLNQKSSEEEDMLDQLHNSTLESRLICQIPVKKEYDGIILKINND